MAPRISLQVPVGLPHLGPGKVPQGQAEAASTFPPFCELVPVLETHVLLISFNVASEVITVTSRLLHPLRSHTVPLTPSSCVSFLTFCLRTAVG